MGGADQGQRRFSGLAVGKFVAVIPEAAERGYPESIISAARMYSGLAPLARPGMTVVG
jgi:hypothetical protein